MPTLHRLRVLVVGLRSTRGAAVLLLNPSLGELSRLRTFALALSDEVDLGDAASGLRTFLNSAAEAMAVPA